MADVNVRVAGLLLDMAALQSSNASRLGYKRAAFAIFALDRFVTEDLRRGTLRSVRGIGPSVERIVRELVETGESATVERALQKAWEPLREDIGRRRLARSDFLSYASADAALRARLPARIVSMKNYRGDFQMHTTWSDGVDALTAMVDAAMARGWWRIAVTDHSYGLPIARGMSMEEVRRQHEEIDGLNVRLAGRFRVLKGIEANILADGRVDMEPQELRRFELVIASPHSLLRKPFDQTTRMLAAVRTPGVHILGHPRGRVFGKRIGILADWPAVFAEAAERGVAIELDGTWDRQDLDASLATQALDAGCLFALNSDAHSAAELKYVDYAMAHARLARLPGERVVNCWSEGQLSSWLESARRR